MSAKIDIKFWVGVVISVFFMALLFRKIDFYLLSKTLCNADYRYIALAVAFTFASYAMRAVRWRYLLISEKIIPFSSLYPATVIGYMANNLLPARLGEFVRAYILANREKLHVPQVFASLVIDRLFDGFTVMFILVATLMTVEFPSNMTDSGAVLRTGGIVTFIIYCVVVVFLMLLKWQTIRTLVWTKRLLQPFPASFSEKLIPLLGSFIAGIKLSSKGGHIAAILISSLIIWLFCIIPVDMILQGFAVNLPWNASMFILVLLVFAVMVPASPGYIGTYHYACYKGLATFGIEESLAISIALVLHGTSFFPVIIAGFYHLWKEKLSFSSVKQSVGNRP